jgi:hypothetical protein
MQYWLLFFRTVCAFLYNKKLWQTVRAELSSLLYAIARENWGCKVQVALCRYHITKITHRCSGWCCNPGNIAPGNIVYFICQIQKNNKKIVVLVVVWFFVHLIVVGRFQSNTAMYWAPHNL